MRLALRLLSAAARPELLIVKSIPAPGTGHIRILQLNRPAARNAISRNLLDRLRSEIDAVARQYSPYGDEALAIDAESDEGPTRAVVIASLVDACFCAGADLKERLSFSHAETLRFRADFGATLAALAALPVPTVAAVAGVAMGGGLELALAAQLRVLASTATVGFPETRLGIIPGAGGTVRLPALIGVARACDLILTGRRVAAPEAYFLGIADRIVDVAAAAPGNDPEPEVELAQRATRSVLDAALQLAHQICEGGPVAVRAALEAVQAAHIATEDRMYQRVLATDDRDEALRAFSEKRKPVFTGR